jgi:hypothetical protein
MAASLFAGCSGGANGVLSSPAPSNANSSAVSLQFRLPAQSQSVSAARNSRAPQYIGTDVTNVVYSFTPGPINGNILLSTCAHAGTPVVYTCTIGVPANTYALTISLDQGGTPVGTGSATGIAVAPSVVTALSLQINPVNSGPVIAANGTPAQTQFYVDNHAQTITTTLNEDDPAGDVISTFYGPVTNYPTLTLSDGAGNTGITLNGGTTTFSTAPAAQTGNSATVAYNGSAVNATSLTLSVSDGLGHTSNTVTIPYITMTNNVAGNIQFAGTGGGNAQTLHITESQSTNGTATFDANVSSVTTCSPVDVSIVPAITGSTTPMAGGLTSFTLTANDITFSPCTVTITSVNDPNLKTTVTLSPSGGASITVG